MLHTEKQSILETKPKAKFLKPAAASSSTEKQSKNNEVSWGSFRFVLLSLNAASTCRKRNV